MEEHIVNGRKIKFSTHKFEGKRTYQEYEKSIYLALNKIGVSKEYIEIFVIDEGVKVSWTINDSRFSFYSKSQESSRENIGAVSQAIQEDVRQIQRGIKDLNLVMKQYRVEKGETKKKLDLNDFKTNESEEINIGNSQKFTTQFSTKQEAKETINQIKSRYSNFTNPQLLPEDVKTSLRNAYMYLGIIVKF